jgi:hypothetical protein
MSSSPITPFASLQARLDRAAPATGLSAIPETDGGGDFVGNLNLTAQEAAPGTPVAKPTKLFYPVVLNQKNSVCLSFIGMGATFCLKTSCSTASHQDPPSGRFTFENEIIVIKKNDVVAFSAPTAPFERMDAALLEHWTANPKSLEEWGEALLAFKRCLESLSSQSDDCVTTDMLSAKKRFQRQMKQARTPARNLFPEESDTKEEDFIEVAGFATPSPFKPSLVNLTLSSKASESEKSLARLIRRVETGLEATTNNLIQNRSIIKDQDKILRGLESRLDTVQDQVGEIPLGLSTEFVAPTLNGRVALIAEKVSFLKPNGSQTSETQVLTWVRSWWKKEPAQDNIAAVQVFSKDCENFLASLVSSFQKQASEVSSLGLKVKMLTLALNEDDDPSPSSSAPGLFASLKQTLGEGVGSRESVLRSQRGLAHQDSPDSSGQASQAVTIAALEQKIRVLDAKMVELSAHSASTTVRFGGAAFSSPRDVFPLIQSEMPTAYFGCFVNAAILFEWIHGNVGDDTLKNMETMRKLKIPSLAEVHALKGLEAALPRLLGDVITFTGRQNTTFYSRVPSASVWTNGSTGTKEFILGSLAAVVSAVRANIDQRLPHGKKLHTLARLALEASSSFIMTMVSFTEENRESYALSNYPDAMQWSLNTRLGYRVWQEVYLPCAGLMEKVEPHDLTATAATVIYHVLRTVDIQESFRHIGIKNHSVISSEYVKFLSTNTGYDSIEKLSSRMTKLETENKDLNLRVKEAAASAKTASTACGDMKKKVDTHEKKLAQKS